LAKIISALAVLLMAAGCGTRTYLYDADPKDPALIFTADFKNSSPKYVPLFSVNTNPSGDNPCWDFRPVGTLPHLRAENRPIDPVTIQVPADQAVTVRVYYYNGFSDHSEYCGPLYVSFTPKEGETYRVHLKADVMEDQPLQDWRGDADGLMSIVKMYTVKEAFYKADKRVFYIGGTCSLHVTNDSRPRSPVKASRFETCKGDPNFWPAGTGSRGEELVVGGLVLILLSL
jgi:hypothetical protein